MEIVLEDDKCAIKGGKGGDDPGKPCVYPFTYKERTYTECTTFENNNTHWCSTEVDASGNYIDGKWGNCNAKCPTAKPGIILATLGGIIKVFILAITHANFSEIILML